MKNKINWLGWGKEAFEKAKKENKPILLDLTAVWCHWCHVMDSTSYSDDRIAQIINNDFIPIKVDIDERPDIRERYNMGGFPSTVFLNHNGDIMAGDTYVPPERLKPALESVKIQYQKNPASSGRVFANKGKASAKPLNKKVIDEGIIKEILISVENNFDVSHGGFGMEPKFPHPDVLDFLLINYKKTKIKKYLDMALKTLDGMRDGIYDNVDFGFFRYSVTQDWKTPHYEKMLDTNAGLLKNYSTAFEITKEEKYKDTVIGVLSYIEGFLSDRKKGGFYGSQDADEEFYSLSGKERKNKRYPYVDKKIYVDWNSMMISSYIRAASILNDNKTIKFALKSADFILDKCYSQKNGLCHFFDGMPNMHGLLNDNIYFLNALIDAHSINRNEKYLENIKENSAFILKNFYDEKAGGFYDGIAKEDSLGMLKYKEKQFLENCFSSIVFLRIYFLTGEKMYRNCAEKTLLHFVGDYARFGHFSAVYAMAADMLLNGRRNESTFD